MRALLPLMGLALGALGAVVSADAPGSQTLILYAHWPATWDEAAAAPVPLDAVYPFGEPDLADGRVAPAASAAGDLPRVSFALVDFVGNRGPARDLRLAAGQPVVLRVTMSSDAASPDVTAELTLRFGDEIVGTGSTPVDLAPLLVGSPVQEVVVSVAPSRGEVLAQEGIWADLALYQLDLAGERALATGVRFHTGEAYPTSIALPLANEPSYDEDEPLVMPARTTDASEAGGTTDARRTIATIVLVVSSGVALVSGARIVKMRR